MITAKTAWRPMKNFHAALTQWIDRPNEATRLELLDASDGLLIDGPLARLVFALRCEDWGGGRLSNEEWEELIYDVKET